LRFFFGHSQWVAWLAHAHLMAGQMDEAGEQADEALRLSRQCGQRGYEALPSTCGGDRIIARAGLRRDVLPSSAGAGR
jgi:hypothetical protein